LKTVLALVRALIGDLGSPVSPVGTQVVDVGSTLIVHAAAGRVPPDGQICVETSQWPLRCARYPAAQVSLGVEHALTPPTTRRRCRCRLHRPRISGHHSRPAGPGWRCHRLEAWPLSYAAHDVRILVEDHHFDDPWAVPGLGPSRGHPRRQGELEVAFTQLSSGRRVRGGSGAGAGGGLRGVGRGELAESALDHGPGRTGREHRGLLARWRVGRGRRVARGIAVDSLAQPRPRAFSEKRVDHRALAVEAIGRRPHQASPGIRHGRGRWGVVGCLPRSIRRGGGKADAPEAALASLANCAPTAGGGGNPSYAPSSVFSD